MQLGSRAHLSETTGGDRADSGARLVDGAYRKLGRASIPADVRPGTQRDAILWAISANNRHGLRPKLEDRRKAAHALLADAEWSRMGDREIGRLCDLSHPTVAKLREGYLENLPDSDSDTRLVERGGTTYEQKTENIGKAGKKKGSGKKKGTKFVVPATEPPDPALAAAYGDKSAIEVLEETQHELEEAQRTIAAAQADDKAAELVKWQRMHAVAQREKDECRASWWRASANWSA